MPRAALLDGDSLARTLRAGLIRRAAALRERGIAPCLATVLVGDDPSSATYVARKQADCRETGIEAREIRLPAGTTEAALAGHLDRQNADPSVHGLLVQLPLPAHLDGARFLARVDPSKDADGLHPHNLGALLYGTPGVLPCTPAGVLALLRHHAVPLAGRHVVIVGRGGLVGRPLAMLLSRRGVDASVTLAHSVSGDLAVLTRAADIVISAAGQCDLIRADMLRPGAAAVGVGISYGTDGAMRSDIADDVAQVAGWVTPPHGSVGALTRAMLLTNLLDLAEASASAASAP